MMSVLTLVSGKEDRTLRRFRVSEIARNPNQPRKYFDPEAIAQLAESIRQYGVLNPLTVRRAPGGGYELVAGERRLRAARVAGLNDVPCLLIAADNEDSSAIALVENLQRRDLDFFIVTKRIDRFGVGLPADWGNGYSHVHICSTCENQDRASFRVPLLLKVPVVHRSIICEPLLEKIDL